LGDLKVVAKRQDEIYALVDSLNLFKNKEGRL